MAEACLPLRVSHNFGGRSRMFVPHGDGTPATVVLASDSGGTFIGVHSSGRRAISI